jgi:hypothetical protein
MLLNISFPHEPFNAAVRDGTAGQDALLTRQNQKRSILQNNKAVAVPS